MPRPVYCLTGLLLLLTPVALPAQAGDTASVMAPIHRLFDGMRSADSAMVRSAFHPLARFIRVDERSDSVRVTASGVDRFVAAVAGADAPWDERLFDTVVHIDGPIASVWTEYTFHLGDRFSHCGVDSIELARGEVGWLITQLADTRRRAPCPEESP